MVAYVSNTGRTWGSHSRLPHPHLEFIHDTLFLLYASRHVESQPPFKLIVRRLLPRTVCREVGKERVASIECRVQNARYENAIDEGPGLRRCECQRFLVKGRSTYNIRAVGLS